MLTIHRLARIAFGGFILSLLCFSVSCALVGEDGSDTIRRELAWDGSHVLVIDVPADVRFVQRTGPGALEAIGPRRSIETLTVRRGHISTIVCERAAASCSP